MNLSLSIIPKRYIHNLLKQCTTLNQLQSLYATMIKTTTNQDSFLMNQFITTYATVVNLNTHFDFLHKTFTAIEKPNVYVYNAMIKAFITYYSDPIRGLEYYKLMLGDYVLPTSYTFSSLIKGCGAGGEMGFGGSVHGHVLKHGLELNVFVGTGLIDFYVGFGRIVDARKVFDGMPERDVFAWSTMVAGYARMGDMGSADVLFIEMPERNLASWNSMIDGYARLGDVKMAESFFRKMPERDVVSWTTMVNCYTRNEQYAEALASFEEMVGGGNGVAPDEVTMASVISACAHLGALDIGRRIHRYVMQHLFSLDVYIGSALVDMYAKCGALDQSLLVFYKLKEKNLFCWNAVIEGLAVHGYAKQALAMFDKMEIGKIEPNWVTFVSVLSACTHAGLVEEGRKRFRSMTDDYCISPRVEHYGCMVDLLSKAGLLDDALDMIRSMEVEPNSVIWGALLGGCKLHRNLEIAQAAVNELKVLEPNNSGHYSLLVNMYAEVNRWREVAEIRAAMKEHSIEKESPGSSWIEIGRKICKFSASDKFHQDSSIIYSLLDELDGQLKLAARMPEVSDGL